MTVAYERVLVFGAHPDDELSMGCTMAKLAAEGAAVYVCVMTDGCEGYPRPDMKDRIVEMRREEADACDKVIGVTKRYRPESPDMALTNDKETLLTCVQIIREVRPNAIFTHGPYDRHRDHLNTHAISVEAWWHAGQPVAAECGPFWKTPHLYYHKGVQDTRPQIQIDVTDFAEKRLEALASQVSQHTLFGRTADEFLAQAESIRKNRPKTVENFWIGERVVLNGFLPQDL